MKTRSLDPAKLLAGLFIVLVALTSAPAAYAESTNGQAKTTLVNALSLVKNADLNFGNLIAGTTAGVVTVSPASARTSTGGVVQAGGTVSAARFQGFGLPGSRVRVRQPSGTYTLTRSGGGATMMLRNLTVEADNLIDLGRGNSGQFRIGLPGLFTVRVGGTIDVGANQLSGAYVGTFDMEVQYF